MRKSLVLLSVILVLALMSIAAADGNGPVLTSSDYIEGKGVVLKLEGDLASMDRTLTVGDMTYELECTKDDEGTWTCVAFVPKTAFGQTAVLQLGVFSFEFTVREPHPAPPPPPPPPPPPTEKKCEFHCCRVQLDNNFAKLWRPFRTGSAPKVGC